MKKIFTFFIALVASVSAIYASNIVDGIWYDFDNLSKTATVTYRGYSLPFYDGEYSGSVVIPSSVTYLDTTYSVTSIGKEAFSGCSSLTSVTIGESVTSIGEWAFYNCSSLTSVTIGESVKSIKKGAFRNCSKLTSVTIPNSVTSIEESAFSGCSSLTSVTIGKSVTSIGKEAFSGCSSLTSVTIGESVKNIGNYAFSGCSSLTSVTIGESVKNIGNYAFSGCSSLTSVTIGESVTSIGYAAFYNCSSLTSVTIPNSVTSIGSGAFEDCSSLTSINIPTKVTCIEASAFRSCSKLTSVTIPNSVTIIRSHAFEGCSSLTSVTIGKSVKSIGDDAFEGCSSLTSVTINSDTIVSEDYESNSNISHIFGSQVTEYIIGNHVKGIGCNAFRDCSSLTSVTIGESVTSIGEWAFYNCSSLTKNNYTGDIAGWCNIKFGKYTANPMWYSHNFYINDQEIKDLVIPNSVTSIGNYAFFYCYSLTSVTIPESVTSIGNSAFRNCSSLTSVNIGESVTSIGSYAFYDCSSLTSVTCKAATPPTIDSKYTFYGVSISIPVYVPCGCVEAYKAANGWKDFTNIQESLAEYSITVDVNDTIMGTAKVDYNTCEGNQISATPNFGYHFVQWSDGNTENPRTLELTQDTTLTAEFAQSFSGQCGDSLYWELVDTTLHITGKGEMYNYKSNTAPWKVLVSSIKVLTIAEDVTKLSQSFGSCSVLESIVWNARHAADAYDDGQYAYPIFYGIRSQIKSFTLGENVEYIPTYLCTGMDKLTTMTIPNSVASIGDYAFYNCSSLTSVIIPNSVTSIGYGAFRDCSSLTSITIPNSVTSIEDWAFGYCSTLSSITIPNSVTSIGYAAFACCSSLTSITIPNSVTSIGEWAFGYCYSLTSITCLAKTPPSLGGINTFEDVSRNIPVYVLCECVENYTFSAWSYFQNIVCLNDEPTGIENVDTHSPTSNCQKILRDGQLLILHNDKTYNVMGLEL